MDCLNALMLKRGLWSGVNGSEVTFGGPLSWETGTFMSETWKVTPLFCVPAANLNCFPKIVCRKSPTPQWLSAREMCSCVRTNISIVFRLLKDRNEKSRIKDSTALRTAEFRSSGLRGHDSDGVLKRPGQGPHDYLSLIHI